MEDLKYNSMVLPCAIWRMELPLTTIEKLHDRQVWKQEGEGQILNLGLVKIKIPTKNPMRDGKKQVGCIWIWSQKWNKILIYK